MPKTTAKKTPKASPKASPRKVSKVAKVTKTPVKTAAKPRRVIQEKPLLFKEVELGAMGVFVVVLVILFIGVAGSLALSFASSDSPVAKEYPLIYRLLYPVKEAPVKVKKVTQPVTSPTPSASPAPSAIPVRISN
jgi:hypothetical protein